MGSSGLGPLRRKTRHGETCGCGKECPKAHGTEGAVFSIPGPGIRDRGGCPCRGMRCRAPVQPGPHQGLTRGVGSGLVKRGRDSFLDVGDGGYCEPLQLFPDWLRPLYRMAVELLPVVLNLWIQERIRREGGGSSQFRDLLVFEWG